LEELVVLAQAERRGSGAAGANLDWLVARRRLQPPS
jgi:hypothetical protein